MGVGASKDTADLVSICASLRKESLPENDANHILSANREDGIGTEHIRDPITEKLLDAFWSGPSDATQVFSLIQPDDVRRLRRAQPRNLARLLRAATAKMEGLAEKSLLSLKDQQQALNCIRLLTRVMPILFEDPEDPFIESVCWRNYLPILQLNDPEYIQAVETQNRLASARARDALRRKPQHQTPSSRITEDDEEGNSASHEEYESHEEDDEIHDSPDIEPLPPFVPVAWSYTPFTWDALKAHTSNIPSSPSIRRSATDGNSEVNSANVSVSHESVDEHTSTTDETGKDEPGTNHIKCITGPSAIEDSQLFDVDDDAPLMDEDEPLGKVLSHCIMKLLFAPGLCVDKGAWTMFKRKFSEEQERHQQWHARQQRAAHRRSEITNGETTPEPSASNTSSVTGVVSKTTSKNTSKTKNTKNSEDPVDTFTFLEDEAPRTLSNAVWPSLLWAGGVGFPTLTPPTSSHYDANRVEILRLVQSLLSQPLYATPDPQSPFRSRFIDVLVAPDCPFAPTLFYSLLNASLTYDPVGWGLPYGAALGTDTAESLMDMSLQVLLLLLDYAALLTPQEALEWDAKYKGKITQRDAADGNERGNGTAENMTSNKNSGTVGKHEKSAVIPSANLNGDTAGSSTNVNNTAADVNGGDIGNNTNVNDSATGPSSSTMSNVNDAATNAATIDENATPATGLSTGVSGDSNSNTTIETQMASLNSQVPSVESLTIPDSTPVYTVPNTHRALLAGLHDPRDCEFMFERISDLLANIHRSDSTMLPYSVKQIGCHQELLVLLWKLLDENDEFRTFVLRNGANDVVKLVTPMLYYMWTGRLNPAKVGLLHLCTFTLLLLSGDRNFGVALNTKFSEKLPTDLPLFDGNHADLLVIVLHKLVVNASQKLSTLYSCFLTIIANISPYVKKFSLVSSVKLLNLCDLFADPMFVLSHPNHHIYIVQLLDTLNNVLQYQYEGNGHIVYGVLRMGNLFEQLSMLTRYLPVAQQKLRYGARTQSHTIQDIQDNTEVSEVKDAAQRSEQAIAEASAAAAGVGSSGPKGTAAAMTDSELVSEETREFNTQSKSVSSTTQITSAHRSGVAPGVESSRPQNNSGTLHAPRPAGPAQPQEAAVGQGKQNQGHDMNDNTWVPTLEWLNGWYPDMLNQLGTPLRLLQHLRPLVEQFMDESEGTADEDAVLNYIRQMTLVGLLPVPHAIVMRRYQPNQYTALWFSTFLWGVVFLRNQEYPVYDSRVIRLFSITVV